MKTVVLNAEKVSKSIETQEGKINILDRLDLKIKQSQSVAIVGKSGSGKSTLLSLLAGLDTPCSGEIKINEHLISSLNEDQRAKLRANKIGFVFQSFYLLEDLTALENIALPLELFGHSSANTRARQWLDKLGLSNRGHHFPKQLSGGEKQRVALARAFVLNPEILFADEPTANLDINTANHVIEHLFELHKNNHSSMVLVTHEESLAQRCDTIYFLKNGRLHHEL